MIDQDQAATPDAVRASEPDDAEVITRSRHEPELFALLFRRHAPRIQRYVARRIGPDAAEDVLAETFLVAFDRREPLRLRPSGRPALAVRHRHQPGGPAPAGRGTAADRVRARTPELNPRPDQFILYKSVTVVDAPPKPPTPSNPTTLVPTVSPPLVYLDCK
jgi:hypothetical protein